MHLSLSPGSGSQHRPVTSDERYLALRQEREAIRAGRDPRGREAELIAEYLMQHRSSISTFGSTHRLVSFIMKRR